MVQPFTFIAENLLTLPKPHELKIKDICLWLKSIRKTKSQTQKNGWLMVLCTHIFNFSNEHNDETTNTSYTIPCTRIYPSNNILQRQTLWDTFSIKCSPHFGFRLPNENTERKKKRNSFFPCRVHPKSQPCKKKIVYCLL